MGHLHMVGDKWGSRPESHRQPEVLVRHAHLVVGLLAQAEEGAAPVDGGADEIHHQRRHEDGVQHSDARRHLCQRATRSCSKARCSVTRISSVVAVIAFEAEFVWHPKV